MTSNCFAVPLTHTTQPIFRPKESSTLHSSLHPLQTLASSGTLSITFFIVNLLLDSHPILILNLYLTCLLLSSRIKLLNFMLVLSLNLSTHHLTLCLIKFQQISLSLVLLLQKKCLNSSLSHLTHSVILIPYLIYS